MSEHANLKTLIEGLPPANRELLPLFAAVVHLPGRARWTVYARAAGEADVRTMLEHRGHTVVEVRRVARVAPMPRTARSQCLMCSYDLNRLPACANAEVTCPECGIINPAIGHNAQARSGALGRRARGAMLAACIMGVLLILGIIARLSGIL